MGRRSTSSERRRAGLALLLLAAVGVTGVASVDTGDPAAEARRLAAANESLREELRLAGSETFYLLLDAESRTLRLMLAGVTLQEYAVSRIEVGAPRLGFLERGLPAGWAGRIHDAGRLVPERERDRLVINAEEIEADAEEQEPQIPATPEELYPRPYRYFVRFAGGLALEIRPEGDGEWSPARGLRARAADLAAAVPGFLRAAPRIRITLAGEDASRLYRAMPPDTRLLVRGIAG